MDNWITIFSTTEINQAELAKQTLENNGIEAVIMNHRDSSFPLGEIQVMVNEVEKERAEEIVKIIKQ